MTAVSKKTRIITRSRYSAWFHPGKENAAVRVAGIKSPATKPHSFANGLRTTRSTFQRWIGFSEDDGKKSPPKALNQYRQIAST
jgi:hypothetical protein